VFDLGRSGDVDGAIEALLKFEEARLKETAEKEEPEWDRRKLERPARTEEVRYDAERLTGALRHA
jgi:hypothetical protein